MAPPRRREGPRRPRVRTHAAVRGFGRAAELYERGRPDYPAAAVRHLARVLHLVPGRTVVELGSGTGKFTRALAPLGAARVAVEPSAGMRRVFARTVPEVPALAGTAEAIPLPDGFADAVVAAQSFHWFRPRRALVEIARVLRPGGGLGLVWNLRDESVGWSRRLTEILDRYGWWVPRAREHRWRPVFDRTDSPFGPLHRRIFHHAQVARPETFVARVLSVSVIAVLPRSERRRVAREVRALLASDPLTRGRAMLTMPYRTEVYWAHRRPSEP
jgi:SAM-dependent methyltransferase